MAQAGETFAAIDIGSSKIKTLVGIFQEDKKLRILGVGVSDSRGIRKGNIVDMEEFKANIDTSLAEAEKMAGEQVSGVYLSLAGTSIEATTATGNISLPQQEITDDDVARSLAMAQSGVSFANRSVLKVVPESFTVDFESGIKNPIGMSAKKLEVRSHIFSAGEYVINNLKKAILDVGIDIYDIYPSLIATPEALLTRRQKELGVVCIDIGASVTGITVYEEGALIFATTIPLGGEQVTSDVAICCRIAIDIAEKLKLDYADMTLAREDSKIRDEEIDLGDIAKNESGVVSKKYLAEIVRARYHEIFHYVNMELKRMGRDGMLPEGAVLTGGGAKVRGLVELAKESLRLPVSIGVPEDSDMVGGAAVGDPAFSSTVGALLLSQKYSAKRERFAFKLDVGSIGTSLKKLISKLLP